MIPVIFDCDFSSDVDDAADLAVACVLHKLGLIEMLCVSCSVSNDKSPGAIAAMLRWYGVNAPVGTWKGAAFDPGSSTQKTWVSYLYDNYDRNGIGLASTVQDANALMRRALDARSQRDCVIVTGSPLNSMNRLLTSSADGESSLTGQELLAAKCRSLWTMCGAFPSGTEWNAQQAPAAAANVAANWPTVVYWSGYEIGNGLRIGASLRSKPATDLVRAAYDQFPANLKVENERDAWGALNVMAMAFGGADYTMTRGTASFDSSTGANSWTSSSTGNHFYLTKARTDVFYKTRLNRLLGADASATLPISAWSGGPAAIAVRA